ncbi:MAG: lyase family protein [Pseudomonadota bacterium]
MTSSAFDSLLFAKLFPTGDTSQLFSDSSQVRAMLLVEAALAKAQAEAGIIPETSAAAIQRASHEVQIDPAALAPSVGQNGVSVPGLVAAFRKEMNAPEHAQFVHWGATSQDIIDTSLMLRLRQALALAERDVKDLLEILAQQAEIHAETEMCARTYGQAATPTTWGAVLAQWGQPLVDSLIRLPALRDACLWVSLSGAAGTASALGDDPAHVRSLVARNLGLIDPCRTWHTDRGPILRISDWLWDVASPLGSMAETALALSASGVEELTFSSGGSSSTMPQKSNPVTASALRALTFCLPHHAATLRSGSVQQHQRDGVAWFTEWLVLPQIVLGTSSALQLGIELARSMSPNVARMKAGIEDGLGLIFAEALSFALCKTMSRPSAQTAAKALCAQAVSENTSLQKLAYAAHPELDADVFTTRAQFGLATADAKQFSKRVRDL